MAEESVSPADLIEQVKVMVDNRKSVAKAVAIPRVARPHMNMNRGPYIPVFMSLGPYHHMKLGTDFESSSVGVGCYQYPELKMSTAEAYKVDSAATILSQQSKSLDVLVVQIEGMLQEIERFYDCDIIGKGDRYRKNFSLMMAIDASFLLSFLYKPPARADGDMISLSTLDVCMKSDIVKLENQIPLFVLRAVFESNSTVCTQSQETEVLQGFNHLLHRYSTVLSPFDFEDIAHHNVIDLANERHLLGFMHAFVSPFLHMQANGTDTAADRPTLLQSTEHFVEVVVAAVLSICVKHPTKKGRRDFLNAYNAAQLEKSGIKFKSFAKPPHRIRFDTYSGTLYLPRITVSHMHTEVFLRNMIALEFYDVKGRNHVTRYVGLMDCIIDTAEDVRVLRDCHVIRRGSLVLTDEWIARMWNGVCHPFFTGQLEPHDDLKSALEEVLIRKYYMSKLRRVLWEVYWDHLSKPGKGIALFVGILLLVMTVVQTYCSLYQLSSKD